MYHVTNPVQEASSEQLPPGQYIIVDVPDLYQDYMNLDTAIRDNPCCTHEDMAPAAKFEFELKELYECARYRPDTPHRLQERTDILLDELDELGQQQDEDGAIIEWRPATDVECETVNKYAKAMEELGHRLAERLTLRGVYTPQDDCAHLHFHSVVNNRYLVLRPISGK